MHQIKCTLFTGKLPNKAFISTHSLQILLNLNVSASSLFNATVYYITVLDNWNLMSDVLVTRVGLENWSSLNTKTISICSSESAYRGRASWSVYIVCHNLSRFLSQKKLQMGSINVFPFLKKNMFFPPILLLNGIQTIENAWVFLWQPGRNRTRLFLGGNEVKGQFAIGCPLG